MTTFNGVLAAPFLVLSAGRRLPRPLLSEASGLHSNKYGATKSIQRFFLNESYDALLRLQHPIIGRKPPLGFFCKLIASDSVSATPSRGAKEVGSRKAEQQGCASFLASLAPMAALICAELLRASVHNYMLKIIDKKIKVCYDNKNNNIERR
jgi:hypothetical protein